MAEKSTERSPLFLKTVEWSMTALFHLTRLLFYIFPPGLFYALFRAMGATLLYLRPGMRRRLEAKISDALPEITDRREITRIARQACASVFMPILDIFTLGRHGERYMRELRIEGRENLARAEEAGKGIIFIGPHIGGVAVVHAVMARLGKPYTPIMYRPEDTAVPRYVEHLAFYAGFLGCDLEEPVFLAGKDIIPKVREHLSRGKCIGLTFDVPGTGVVEFFGRPAALAAGAGYFAYDTGAPIQPFCLLRGKGTFDNRLIFLPPIFCDTSADKKSEVARVMREVVKAGERTIRMAPGQWMSWFGLWAWWDQAREIMEKGA